jgi:hypothetical protein
LGAHAPDLTDEEIDFIHKLWLDVTHEKDLGNVRHKHIVIAALVHLADELHSEGRHRVLQFIRTLNSSETLKATANERRQRRRRARLRRRA